MNSLLNPCTRVDGRRSGRRTIGRITDGWMGWQKSVTRKCNTATMIRLLSSLSSSSPSLEWMIDLFAHLIYVLLRRTKSSEPPPAPPHAVSARPRLTVRRASAGASTPRGALALPPPRDEGGRNGVGFSVKSSINADIEDAEV